MNIPRGSLEEALAIAREALDASADSILVVDRRFRVLLYNRRFVEMWHPSPESLASGDGRRMAEAVKDQMQDPDAFMGLATKPFADDADEERRDIIRLKDGRVFERIVRPYRMGGEVAGRTITTRDLTLHFEGVNALAQARDEALETAKLRTRFVASVSHELRTPLNAVVAAAELLRGLPLDGEAREHAETAARAARALLELVEDVLDFSKIEASRMTVGRGRLTPGEILAEAAALVAPRAAEKGLALRAEAGEAARLDLIGDHARVRQVLLNLLVNAVKFTDRGEIAASASAAPAGESAVDLEFSVRDTGRGVEPELRRRLFTPFAQGDDEASRRQGGVGLGLAISKSLVELMGGSIGFESEPGRGSRFWFRVKLERAAASAPPAPKPAPARPAGRRDRLRVLVVEDNEINRRLLTRQLERLGCRPDAAADGRAALLALGAADYGLVLLDCQMPELDGCATAVEIRRLEDGRRRVPLVAVSANTSAEDRRRCLEAGMDDFVPKPASLEALDAALARWDLPYDEAALAAFAGLAAESADELPGLIARFLDDAQKSFASARAARAEGNPDACRRAAHAVKGAAATVGARGLRELSRRIEEASAGAAAELDSLLSQADAEVLRLRADAARRFAAKS